MGVSLFFSLHSQMTACATCGGTLRRLWGLLCLSLTTCAASLEWMDSPFEMYLQD